MASIPQSTLPVLTFRHPYTTIIKIPAVVLFYFSTAKELRSCHIYIYIYIHWCNRILVWTLSTFRIGLAADKADSRCWTAKEVAAHKAKTRMANLADMALATMLMVVMQDKGSPRFCYLKSVVRNKVLIIARTSWMLCVHCLYYTYVGISFSISKYITRYSCVSQRERDIDLHIWHIAYYCVLVLPYSSAYY